MDPKAFFCLSLLLIGYEAIPKKLNAAYLKEYSPFLNFGDKKLSKFNRTKLENSLLKSKVDVLGDVFKRSIDAVKATSIMDLVFLIDASSSVGEDNFQSELKFVKKFLSDVTVDYNNTRVAIITYSSSNNVFKNVDEITEPEEENNKCLLLNKQLKTIRYTGGGTYTLGAFKLAQHIFRKSRDESKKVLFLITDGFSNGGDPVPVAEELKQKGVVIFTLGVQNGNYKELYELASSPGEMHSFLLDSFQEFENLARRALHVDLQSGEYIPLANAAFCGGLCEGKNCCDEHALCTCGTSTGHYSCMCQPGYYGSGLKNSCSPCPSGSYARGSNLCLPCPDINHVTTAPAIGIESCKCKIGYQSTSNYQCEVIKCPELLPPEFGFFVMQPVCINILNNACGVRCQVGYTLSGSSIRLCQTNGTWSGSEPSCQIRTCEKMLPPTYGFMKCEHADLGKTYDEDEDMPVDTVCKFKCVSGRTLVGSNQRTCLPIAQWDGLKTSCKLVKCHKLPKMPYLKVEPRSCAIGKQQFGKKCKFSCAEGFKLVGPEEKECTGQYGTWTNNSDITACQDVTPPVLSCPSDIRGDTVSGKNFGTVTWDVPVVTDNSGLEVTVWTKPAIKKVADFRFKIGKTVVTYYAQDVFKNLAKCDFSVEIEDNEHPTIEECESPPPFLSSDAKGANITWDEPHIFDNSQEVEVVKSHRFGFFETGTTQVTYTATDPSNNTNTCVLTVTVQVSMCEELPSPAYGVSECKPTPGVTKCVISCQEGYAVPLNSALTSVDTDKESVDFICNDADPVWYTSDGQLYPECTVVEVPDEVTQEGEITINSNYNEDICKDSSKLKDLQNEINNDLLANVLDDSCVAGVNCNLQTRAECEDELEAEEEKTNIIKRDVARANATSGGKAKKPKKNKKINVKFKLTAKLAKGGRLKVKAKPIDMKKKMRKMSFIQGRNVTTAYAFKFKDPVVVCPPGFATKRTKCVQCPLGTFHNATRKLCQSCPVGQYYDKHGGTACTQCPKYYSTRRLGAKSLSECVEQCAPGTFARRKLVKKRKHPNAVVEKITLKPYCRSCPIGQYQPGYGQTKCVPCPSGYTTTHRKATSADQCTPTIQEICSNKTNICNNGVCIIENDYYSCSCFNNYIGSHCEISVNSCSSYPCLNGGHCKLYPNEFSTDYLCVCKEGFAGKYCEQELEKCPLKCINNGTCIRDEEDGNYVCLCPKGYGGLLCETKILHCRPNLCENNGRCVEQPEGYKCICRNGYMGTRCHILPCDYQPCQGNATCLNLIQPLITRDSFKCECPAGYAGIDCSLKISYCRINPCLNGGTCESLTSTYKCVCPKIFYGKNCENALNGNYILNFPSAGTTDFIRMDGFKENLTQISMCLWMQTVDSFNYGTILSYATEEYDNTFTLTDYTGLVVYINNDNMITDVFLNDGHWHFLCFTWESDKGAFNLYLDGVNIRNGTNFQRGAEIQGEGKLVIGQEQDVLGGKFSQSESFLGKMAHLDVWSRVLTPQEVNHYMLTCTENVYGDLYAWHEFRLHLNGALQALPSTFCKTCEDPKPVAAGFINIVDNVAHYQCYKGYDLVNPYPNGRKCNKAAKWEGLREPYCKIVYCGRPGYFKNGYILGRRYNYRDRIVYRCNVGYNVSGLSVRQCSESGKWVPEEPRCLGSQCDAFPKPKHSHIVVLPDDTYEEYLEELSDFDVGMALEFTCAEGTKLVGAKVLTCLKDGTWNYPIPFCMEVPHDPTTTTQSLTGPTTRSSGAQASLVEEVTRPTMAHTDFKEPESRKPHVTLTTSTSTTTTTPSPSTSTISTTTSHSSAASIDTNATTSSTTSTSTTTPSSTTSTSTTLPETTTQATPSTTSSTTLKPTTQTTTTTTEEPTSKTTTTITSTIITTTQKSTTQTTTPTKTTPTTPPTTPIQTTVTSTTTQESTTQLTATTEKTGNEEIAKSDCDVKKIPPPPLNGYMDEDSLSAFKDGKTNAVHYKCRFGHILKGHPESTCIIDGYWTELNMTCDLVPCPVPLKGKFMDIKYNNISSIGYFFGNMVVYECTEGYKFVGNNIIRCTASGKWTRMHGKCIRKSCYKPIIKDETIIDGFSYLYQDKVTLICKNEAKYELVCGSDGKWQGEMGKDC